MVKIIKACNYTSECLLDMISILLALIIRMARLLLFGEAKVFDMYVYACFAILFTHSILCNVLSPHRFLWGNNLLVRFTLVCKLSHHGNTKFL